MASRSTFSLTKIVSGGQTGVDRGALDAALACGFPCGGWCPDGRYDEQGIIPVHYPLTELPGAGYAERTAKNVEDSDATLIITFGELEGGTAYTWQICCRLHKPHLIIDASETSPEQAAQQIQGFISQHAIGVLNVAGPRASKAPLAQAYTTETFRLLLTSLNSTALKPAHEAKHTPQRRSTPCLGQYPPTPQP